MGCASHFCKTRTAPLPSHMNCSVADALHCLGPGGVFIKGIDLGIVGMKVGGQRRLIIPPELGYGDRQVQEILPGSTLNRRALPQGMAECLQCPAVHIGTVAFWTPNSPIALTRGMQLKSINCNVRVRSSHQQKKNHLDTS